MMIRALHLLVLFCWSVSILNAQPKASFSASPSNGCAPATIKFIDQSSGTSLTYFWDLGNGNTSTLKNPQAIYYNPGLYTVKLFIKDNAGKTDSFIRVKYVEIFKNPVADFDAKNLKGCTPFDPGLIDKSTRGSGMINQWSWDYSDGTVINKQSPSHSYLTKGIYDISLIVKDVNGCQAKATKKQYITVNSSATVAFSADKLSSCTTPLQVNFTDRSSGTGSGDSYLWDFGDGTTSTSQNPKKTYSSVGNFTVKLTITSANGCVANSQLSNYITISRIKPSFSLSNSQVCRNDAVTFTNNSTPKGLKFDASWDFGDGTSSTGNKVAHTYTSTGLYSVTLTVSLTDGTCKETVNFPNAINILDRPKAKFLITDTILCYRGMRDTFIDKSAGGISRSWFLNDSFISSNNWVSIRIKKKGYNKVGLVSGNGYCFDTLINPKAILVDTSFADFVIDPQKGCKPLKVKFENRSASASPITQVFWDLGDGNYQNQNTFDYTYYNEGMYVVKLTVTNSLGCSFKSTDTVYVGTKPELEFDEPVDSLCQLDLLTVLDAKNTKSSKVDQWRWYLDTSLISTNKILNYRVKNKDGTYDLKLIGSHWGCSDTVVFDNGITILPPDIRYIIKYDSCKGYPFTFINKSDQADEFRWYFADNTFLANIDTLVVYGPADKWPVKLWGRNNTYNCESEYYDFLVPYATKLDFSFTGGLCGPAKLLFSNLSSGYSEYKWDFGNGIESNNSLNFYKTFNPGTYKLKLMGSHDNGCKETIEKTVTINGPVADFKVTPNSGCAPLDITLISNVDNPNVKSKYWQISGHPKIAVTKDTMHFILDKQGPLLNGAYSVGLLLEDFNGCSGLATDTVSLTYNNYNFEVSTFPTCAYPIIYLKPLFSASDSNLVTNAMYWDMGDGRTFTGGNIAHQYQNEGNYKVSLKMIDTDGCVTVRDTIINNSDRTIKADMVADKLDANCPPFTVHFQSRSINNFGKIVKYHWDFGDGSTSDLPSPSHIYLVSGKFTVKLKVTNDVNCSDEIVYKDLILIDGPVGTFNFDKKIGCTPLNVNFTSNTQNTHHLEWDMGDGQIIKDSLKPGYVYSRVGKYIPILVLADSFGCKYTVQPKDTIHVLPQPKPDFSFGPPCIDQEVKFSNLSDPVHGSIVKFLWDFGDGITSDQSDPSHIYKKSGKFLVKLMVWNTGNCQASIEKEIVVKNIEAAFKTANSFYCKGQVPQLVNTSVSDTFFKSWKWFLNGTLLSNAKIPALSPMTSGVYEITLVANDLNGCTDTLTLPNGITIGDTFPPLAPFIYRVTVQNDQQVLLDYSGFKGYDFKHYTIYKLNASGEFGKYISESDKYDTSLTISALNTLSNVYCFKVTATNLCGYESSLSKALDHCTVETKAVGEIRRVNVKWNSYKGWPVNKYEIYREELGNKGVYHFLAEVNGNTLQYIDTAVYCKMDHFYRIKAYENAGFQQVSWSDTTAGRPLNKHAVPPNFTIRATVDFDEEIILEWTGSGNPRIPIKEYVIERSEDGKHYKWSKSFSPEEYSFTDKKVRVDDMSYFYRTYAVDTCEQRSEIQNFAKTILLKADTTVEERPFVTWSTYQGWNEEVNQYEVQRKKEDGSFVTIGNTSSTDTLMVDNVTDLNGYPYYCYRVIGYKNLVSGQKQIISISNEDCAPVRSRIFAANAFTINGDGLNEIFDIKGLYIKRYNIKIFNRWGEKVFESNDMNVDWDGYYKGELCQMGAYIWIIKAVGVDDVNWPLKGTVTIVR